MFDPYDFFILRPLRWAFSQAFGSKSKIYFDQTIRPLVLDALPKIPLHYADLIMRGFLGSGQIDKWVEQMMIDLAMPAAYRPVAKENIINQVQAILAAFK